MCQHVKPPIRLRYYKYLAVFAWLLSCGLTHAEVPTQETERQSKWSYQLGVDAWDLKPSTTKDTYPGFIAESTNLLLPNAHTKRTYSDVSTFGWLIGEKPLTDNTFASLKARADQTIGWRIDEAQVTTNISPSLGVRYGVVDYKTSWCRHYESDNYWMREIETICSTPEFRDVTGGSPGAQIFVNAQKGNYALQSQVGIYRPLLLGYAHREFGNLTPSPNYRVLANQKVGINFNLIDLTTALEVRVSYMKGYQKVYLPESDLLGNFQQTSDMVYFGVSMPITTKITGRITHMQQKQRASCRSEVAKFDTACNLNLTFDKSASSMELSYRADSLDTFSLGVNQTSFDENQNLFTQPYDTYASYFFYFKTKQTSVAWRHDWSKGVFSVLQFIHAKHLGSDEELSVKSHGTALGARVAYQY
jgi:hypothetical protein